jgi:hypothetical protein
MWNVLTQMVGWIYPLSGPPNQAQTQTQTEITTKTQTETTTKTQPAPGSQGNLTDSGEVQIMHNWEWMLSTAETIAQQQDQRRADEIRKELDTIKRVTNSIHYRKQIREAVTKYWSSLSPSIVATLESSRLDASKRDRICRDLVRQSADAWLTQILTHIFMPADPTQPNQVDLEAFMRADAAGFAARWKEQPYKKNICGELAAMAFRTSHPCQDRGLTPNLVAEILWSLHLTMSREISLDVNRTLTEHEFAFLATLLGRMMGDVVALWNTTTLATGTVTERAGKLPEKWAQADRLRQEQLAQIKATPIHRYNDGPVDPLWKQHQEAVKSQEQADLSISMRALGSYKDKSFANRRALLANNLVLRAVKK